MNPFQRLTTTDYTFLELESIDQGNIIKNEYPANGIVKLRDTYQQSDSVESNNSTSSVHIRPYEPFVATLGGNMIGHGIRVSQDAHKPFEYRIIDQVVGKNYRTGEVAFYRVVLKRESIAKWDESELPLL